MPSSRNRSITPTCSTRSGPRSVVSQNLHLMSADKLRPPIPPSQHREGRSVVRRAPAVFLWAASVLLCIGLAVAQAGHAEPGDPWPIPPAPVPSPPLLEGPSPPSPVPPPHPEPI